MSLCRYAQLEIAHQRVSGWTALVQSALEFLADQCLVSSVLELGQLAAHSWNPQMGMKDSDSDALLQELCSIWLQQHQDSSMDGSKLDVESSTAVSDLNDSMLHSPSDAAFSLGSGLCDLGEDLSDVGSASFFDNSDVVHPPRSVTSWTVKPSTAEERASYQVRSAKSADDFFSLLNHF